MVRNVSLIVLAMSVALATGYADQTRTITLPVHPTDATNGKQMYGSYCASCHGTDGRGNGPMASSLNSRPTDLTALARVNHGKFPANHVATVLRFGPSSTNHGSAQMPAWGHVLGNLSSVYQQQEQDLRISNLTRYIGSMQVK